MAPYGDTSVSTSEVADYVTDLLSQVPRVPNGPAYLSSLSHFALVNVVDLSITSLLSSALCRVITAFPSPLGQSAVLLLF
jgi:hypothetical protein